MEFDAPEFYEPGEVFRVRGDRYVSVWRDGESSMENEDGRTLRTSAEFRQEFPAGALLEDVDDGWLFDAGSWFEIRCEATPRHRVESLFHARYLARELASGVCPSGLPLAPARSEGLRETLARPRTEGESR